MKINQKFVKIMIVILLLVMIGLVISKKVFAWDVQGTMGSLETAAEEGGQSGEEATKLMGSIINIVSTIGAGIAIIMLVVIGIQYVSKGAEGKAEAKKDLTGYIIGAVLLFGVSGILRLLQIFIDGNVNSIGNSTSGTNP
ncbi:MAG: hypothetical protein IJ867_05505 [Clostridia bacterium]|nr:hypothetical protein [Clostridia bacterium]